MMLSYAGLHAWFCRSLGPQKEDSDKPVSDQWLDAFVIVGEDNNPVGTVQDGEARAGAARVLGLR